MPSEDIDIQSATYNMEDDSLDNVLDGMIDAIQEFRCKFAGRPIYTTEGGMPSLGVTINPRGDGDFWFWIGGQVR